MSAASPFSGKFDEHSRPAAKRMTLMRFKEVLREQYRLVRLDEQRAIDTASGAAWNRCRRSRDDA